jgi:hypothetical protein
MRTDMTYTFHNRLTIFEERINIDVPTYELADTDDEHVILLAGERDTTIAKTGNLVVEGSGYPDEAAAVAAARGWRKALTVAFARAHIGADFGPDDRIAPDEDLIVGEPSEILNRLGIKCGDRVVWDAHRLLVVTSAPRPRFLHATGSGTVTRGLGDFERSLTESPAQTDQEWSAEKSLAYRLVHNALRDDNQETQHIQLVTAIEVLLKQQDRPPAIMTALNGLIDEVESRAADEEGVQKRLLEILRDDLDESISRTACDQLSAVLTDTYGGKEVVSFFGQVYGMRSRLLHRKRRRTERRPTATELGEVHFELLRLVLDFLEASE